jgi:hypothetical protein
MEKRMNHPLPIEPGGVLGDYVPFYFTPKSPMLLNIKTGRGIPVTPMRDIVILVASLNTLRANGHSFLITDRHAYLQTARFSNRMDDLDWLPWQDLQNHDFKADPNRPDKMERYQAEALIHHQLPVTSLAGIVFYEQVLAERAIATMANPIPGLKIISKPEYYF